MSYCRPTLKLWLTFLIRRFEGGSNLSGDVRISDSTLRELLASGPARSQSSCLLVSEEASIPLQMLNVGALGRGLVAARAWEQPGPAGGVVVIRTEGGARHTDA